MASYNYVCLVGNLTRDPEVRHLASGDAVAEIGLAVNERFKNKAGEQQEKVNFFDLVAWGKTAELCAQYLRKGSPAMFVGKLQLDQWTTEAGEKRSKVKVRVDSVQFLGSKPASGEQAAPAPRAPAPAEQLPGGGNGEPPPDFF